MTNVVHVDFRPRPVVAEPLPHTAEQIRLIGAAGAIVAVALGASAALARSGKKALARERLLLAARDLATMYERCRLEEIEALAGTMIRTAQEIRLPRSRLLARTANHIVERIRP